ncbi:hypothetical protein [Streptomyces sp. NPDC002122]|uniref:hypothetical protein n=1 Tax=Streptomyces sp. NPDC002122 TaxID=3154407 RepID=UPI0033298E07
MDSAVYNLTNLVKGIALFLGVEQSEEGISVRGGGLGEATGRLSMAEIDESLVEIKEAKRVGADAIHWPDRAEFFVVPLDNYGFFDRELSEAAIDGGGEAAPVYRVGKPSRAFTFHLLCLMGGEVESLGARRKSMLRHRTRTRVARARMQGGEFNLLDVVGDAMLSTTLSITSPADRSDFEALANSFLFHAAYNLDASARIGVHPLLDIPHIPRMRHRADVSLDAPRQIYDAELVQHYLMGVAAEIPLLEYLSYYHIVEHFFRKVFDDDLAEQVKRIIVDPSFSIRRPKDVQKVIKKVDGAMRGRRDDGGGNEKRSLEIVIEKFVDVDRLTADLTSLDSSLVERYRTIDVSFAKAGKVDLKAKDWQAERAKLAGRIYAIRNSLVHAKEGVLPKYAPFAHDVELRQEIPLIRFIAEQVIIFHGKLG